MTFTGLLNAMVDATQEAIAVKNRKLVNLACNAGETARIQVLDTGIGIGEDELERVFGRVSSIGQHCT